jgi:hypothetical protein
MGQYPNFATVTAKVFSDITRSSTTSIKTLYRAAKFYTIPAPMPLSGLEQLTAETGINILNLLALIESYVGQAVSVLFYY